MSLQVEEATPSHLRSGKLDDNLFSVIRNRRSTRAYSDKPVSEEMIRSLIDYSIQAPSAMNLQPWSFVVVENKKLLKEISEKVKKRLSSNPTFKKESTEHGMDFLFDADFDIFYGAPVLVIICAKEKPYKEFKTEPDCFLAGENLMLAATGMGLATCPIGLAVDLISEPEMKKKLGIASYYTPVLPIVLGYASETPPHVERNPAIINWVR